MKNQASAVVRCSIGDYVVGKVKTAESHVLVFGKVHDVGDGLVTGVHEKNSHIQKLRKPFEVVAKDVDIVMIVDQRRVMTNARGVMMNAMKVTAPQGKGSLIEGVEPDGKLS